MRKKVAFFREAIKSLKTSGTVIPSSRFLVKKILNKVNFTNAKVIVELGGGDGIITKEILNRIEPTTTLVCFEINEKFLKDLKKIKNNQLIIVNASAENIKEELSKINISAIDIVISSLPMAIIPKPVAQNILEKSYQLLVNKGNFVQYQYSPQFLKPLKKIFKDKVKMSFEPLNIPPAFVYICEK